jgi:hypothetical protein
MSDSLLQIWNHHVAECGGPPIATDEKCYVGYFENAHGEQWVFTFDRESKKAELRGGDIGWNDVREVRGGQVPGLILSADERLWLQACCAAANVFFR